MGASGPKGKAAKGVVVTPTKHVQTDAKKVKPKSTPLNTVGGPSTVKNPC